MGKTGIAVTSKNKNVFENTCLNKTTASSSERSRAINNWFKVQTAVAASSRRVSLIDGGERKERKSDLYKTHCSESFDEVEKKKQNALFQKEDNKKQIKKLESKSFEETRKTRIINVSGSNKQSDSCPIISCIWWQSTGLETRNQSTVPSFSWNAMQNKEENVQFDSENKKIQNIFNICGNCNIIFGLKINNRKKLPQFLIKFSELL